MCFPRAHLPAVLPLAPREDAPAQGAPGQGSKAGSLTVVALDDTEPICGAATGAQHAGQPLNAALSNAGVLQGSPGIGHCGEGEHRGWDWQWERSAVMAQIWETSGSQSISLQEDFASPPSHHQLLPVMGPSSSSNSIFTPFPLAVLTPQPPPRHSEMGTTP